MRLNVYSQELTCDYQIVEKEGSDGLVYSALMMLLHSSDRLHQPPLHTGKDDDRSAVTFWLPKSPQRRELFAQALESMASSVRQARSENEIEQKARELAKARFETEELVGITASAIQRDLYVDKRWYDFQDEARRQLVESKATILPEELKKDPRIFLMLHFLFLLEQDNKASYSKEELHTMYTNTIYLMLPGSHEERAALMHGMLDSDQ